MSNIIVWPIKCVHECPRPLPLRSFISNWNRRKDELKTKRWGQTKERTELETLISLAAFPSDGKQPFVKQQDPAVIGPRVGMWPPEHSQLRLFLRKLNWCQGNNKISFHLSWQKWVKLDLPESTFAENEANLGKSHGRVCLGCYFTRSLWHRKCHSACLSDEPSPLRTYSRQREEWRFQSIFVDLWLILLP